MHYARAVRLGTFGTERIPNIRSGFRRGRLVPGT